MNIKNMKPNKVETREKLIYVSDTQINFLNNWNEKNGKSFRWNDSNTQKAFFDDKQIPYEDVDGWAPYLCNTSKIEYFSKQGTYCFPIMFGDAVAYLYAFDQYVGVDDETEAFMIHLKEISEKEEFLPF